MVLGSLDPNNFHRRRRFDLTIRNGAGFVGFELRDMEDGVDGTHILGDTGDKYLFTDQVNVD